MSDFNTLKSLYEDGYRCIYYDKLENNHTIYLKNFDNENSTVIELEDENEFSQFQDYINDLNINLIYISLLIFYYFKVIKTFIKEKCIEKISMHFSFI